MSLSPGHGLSSVFLKQRLAGEPPPVSSPRIISPGNFRIISPGNFRTVT